MIRIRAQLQFLSTSPKMSALLSYLYLIRSSKNILYRVMGGGGGGYYCLHGIDSEVGRITGKGGLLSLEGKSTGFLFIEPIFSNVWRRLLTSNDSLIWHLTRISLAFPNHKIRDRIEWFRSYPLETMDSRSGQLHRISTPGNRWLWRWLETRLLCPNILKMARSARRWTMNRIDSNTWLWPEIVKHGQLDLLWEEYSSFPIRSSVNTCITRSNILPNPSIRSDGRVVNTYIDRSRVSVSVD